MEPAIRSQSLWPRAVPREIDRIEPTPIARLNESLVAQTVITKTGSREELHHSADKLIIQMGHSYEYHVARGFFCFQSICTQHSDRVLGRRSFARTHRAVAEYDLQPTLRPAMEKIDGQPIKRADAIVALGQDISCASVKGGQS